MLISIIIRTLNEETYLGDLLDGIRKQELDAGVSVETVLVDSGSTDRTLEIAERAGCRITHIEKSEFSFGRSLNVGCDFAEGDILVFVSGHCVPCDARWLANLIRPLTEGACSYSYGCKRGYGPTKFSETQVFLKYYPAFSMVPQSSFYANNANAAIPRDLWQQYRFDEALTGLEDMHLAKRMVSAGHQIGYVADAGVYHIHDESWRQVRNRFEREGAALTEIMPESGLSLVDFVDCTVRSICRDFIAATRQGALRSNALDICMFRTLQYWGSYRGTRFARMVASMRRKTYFHPDKHFERQGTPNNESHRADPDEGAQQSGTREEFSANRRQATVPLDSR